MADVPTISSVLCTAAGSLPSFSVDWSTTGSTSGLTLNVFALPSWSWISGASNMQQSPGTWSAGAELSQETPYQILIEDSAGNKSQPVMLLFSPPTDVAATFDGVELLVSWTPPVGATQPTTNVILLTTSAGTQSTSTSNRNSGSIVVEAGLLGSQDWTVTVTPQASTVTGPASDPAPVQQGQGGGGGTGQGWLPSASGPKLEALRVEELGASQFRARVQTPAPQPPGEMSYFIALVTWRGLPVAKSPPAPAGTPVGGLFTFEVLVPGSFPRGRDYTLALAPASGPNDLDPSGPPGLGLELILGEVREAEVAVRLSDGGTDREVTVAVTPPQGPWLASGVIVGLRDSSGDSLPGSEVGGAGFAHTTLLPSPTPGETYNAYAALSRGLDIGPIGLAQWPVLTEPPTIEFVEVDGELLQVRWKQANPRATGHRLVVTSEGHELARTTIQGASSGVVRLPGWEAWPDAVAALTVAVQGVAGHSAGPFAQVAALGGPPRSLTAQWSPSTGDCTLTWEAPLRSEGLVLRYEVEVLDGSERASLQESSQTEAVLSGALFPAGGRFGLRVRAVADGDCALTGPWSETLATLSVAPARLDVDWNGAVLTARCLPVPGASGYRFQLLEGDTPLAGPWDRDRPFLELAPGAAITTETVLVVQGLDPQVLGPAARAPVFAPGWLPQVATGSAGSAVWLNPAIAPDGSPHPIVIGLPDIFAHPPVDLPTPGPFSLATASDHEPYAYALTIAGGLDALPWVFAGDPVRAELRGSYTSFLLELEVAGATPFGIQTVQSAIARAMPQTFVETLYYAYGFLAGDAGGSVDLLPGMVLRAEHAAYQTLGRAVPGQKYLDGFIPSAVAEYPISRVAQSAQGVTALDAFVGWLTAQGGTVVPDPQVEDGSQAGAGGSIDSGITALRQPFWRLVYPRAFPSMNSDDTGLAQPEANALILAARSYALLEAATQNIRRGAPAGPEVGTLYFRGRSTLVPLLRVWLDGAPLLLPLGSTVADALATRAMDPPALSLPLTRLRLRRGLQAALVGFPPAYDVGAGAPVRLDWAVGPRPAYLGLPLLGGDRLDTGRGA